MMIRANHHHVVVRKVWNWLCESSGGGAGDVVRIRAARIDKHEGGGGGGGGRRSHGRRADGERMVVCAFIGCYQNRHVL